MPEYLAPGVFIEEFEIGARPIEGVPTSTAGFLGEAERGRTRPKLVTSWLDYQRNFGGFFGDDKYLPYAVNSFFENGGSQCYISRIVNDADGAATEAFGDLTVNAIGPGEWGNTVYAVTSAGSTRVPDGAGGDTPKGFRLRVFYWRAPPADLDPADPESRELHRPDHEEDFDDLELEENSANYWDKRVNHGGSKLVEIEVADTATLGDIPPESKYLAGGVTNAVTDPDYSGANLPPDDRRGLSALELSDYDDIAILYAPAVSDDVAMAVISHCENNRYRFAILDAPVSANDPGNLNPRTTLTDTQYAAFYYPWIEIASPVTGARKLIPPGGAMAGIYARSDNERGVWKAPANEVIRGALRLQHQIDTNIQKTLNPRGVNALRRFPGRGRRVWGARTLSSNSLWKYINVRRLFIFIERSIYLGTQWVVFEPNDDRLWARVRQTITAFLRTQWREGALMGLKEEDAFFVKADRETMTDDDIANGRLIVVIGIAPVRPAEFVIFRIAQLTGSAADAAAA